MKENKYGCRKSGDVCLIHSSPLLGFDFCEDSETIKDFKNELMRKIEKVKFTIYDGDTKREVVGLEDVTDILK